MNIIALNGRINSGKDTIAAMIQNISLGYEYAPENIAYNNGVKTKLNNSSDWKIHKFAYKLKLVASILTGMPVEEFEKHEVKESLLGAEWAIPNYVLNSIDPFKDIDFIGLITVRTFLQRLGTEALRNHLHENVWLNALWADYKEGDKWLITDCRFKNEAKSVRDNGGMVIRLTRNDDVDAVHPSETDLDNFDFDYIIDNKDKSLEETYELVKGFYENI